MLAAPRGQEQRCIHLIPRTHLVDRHLVAGQRPLRMRIEGLERPAGQPVAGARAEHLETGGRGIVAAGRVGRADAEIVRTVACAQAHRAAGREAAGLPPERQQRAHHRMSDFLADHLRRVVDARAANPIEIGRAAIVAEEREAGRRAQGIRSHELSGRVAAQLEHEVVLPAQRDRRPRQVQSDIGLPTELLPTVRSIRGIRARPEAGRSISAHPHDPDARCACPARLMPSGRDGRAAPPPRVPGPHAASARESHNRHRSACGTALAR